MTAAILDFDIATQFSKATIPTLNAPRQPNESQYLTCF